jgi:hypothetical protein
MTAALLLMVQSLASAQDADQKYRGQGYFFVGFGTGTAVYSPPLILEVGGGGERFLYKGLGVGAEAGIVKLTWNPWPGTAVTASGDLSYHFGRHARRGGVDPFVLGGASFVGPTKGEGGRGSPAGNYGGGVNLWREKHVALRFEFRDVVGATQFWPYPHYISWRVGVTFR